MTVAVRGQKRCDCSQFYSLYLWKLVIMAASQELTNCRTCRCVLASLVCEWPWEGMRVAGRLENLFISAITHVRTQTCVHTRFYATDSFQEELERALHKWTQLRPGPLQPIPQREKRCRKRCLVSQASLPQGLCFLPLLRSELEGETQLRGHNNSSPHHFSSSISKHKLVLNIALLQFFLSLNTLIWPK